jgi:hypothetical protein
VTASGEDRPAPDPRQSENPANVLPAERERPGDPAPAPAPTWGGEGGGGDYTGGPTTGGEGSKRPK